MRVRQVLGSGARRETYTLVDDNGRVVELVDDYLALCTDREHSPNTLRARAYDLKEWLTFLRLLDIMPLAAVPEHVDQFAGWLRPPVGPGQLRPVNADDAPSRPAPARANASKGLRGVHDTAWHKAGQPEREAWIADPVNGPAGLSPEVGPCMVPGCPYSGGMSRLCDPHIAQWNGLRSRGQHVAAAEFTGMAVPLPRPATAATSVGPGPPAAASSGALRRHALAVQGIRASRSPD